MGYELIYHYHEEISKGEYNRDEIKTKSVKVGSPYDDMPLENVAGKIIAQLARRNILVVDVEIYEFTKKKLNYREADDGIVIKNKKFKFDDGAVVEVSENNVVENNNSGIQTTQSVPIVQKPIVRYEIFNPPVELLKESKRRGYLFTVGKKYPIYKELTAPRGINYLTLDDSGFERVLHEQHFSPNVPGLGQENIKISSDVDLWKDVNIELGVMNLRG